MFNEKPLYLHFNNKFIVKYFTFLYIFFFLLLSSVLADNIKSDIFVKANSIFQKTDTSFNLAYKILEIAKKENNLFEEGIAYSNIGFCYYNKNKTDSALKYTLKALNIIKTFNDKTELAILYNQIALIYMQDNKDIKAIKHLIKAAQIFEQIKDYNNLQNVQLNIGNLYLKIKEFDKCELYFLKSLESFKKINQGSDIDKYIVLSSLGTLYNETKEYNKSLKYLMQSLQFFKSINSKPDIIMTEVVISNNYIELNKTDESLKHILNAYKLSLDIQDSGFIGYTSNFVGNAYLNKNNFDSAEYYLKNGLLISKKFNNIDIQINDNISLYELYKKQGNYKKALFYFEKHKTLEDSLLNEKNKNKILELETIYQSNEKDKKIKILASEKKINALKLKQKNSTILFISILSLFILIFMFFIIINIRKKQKIQQQLIQEKANLKIAETEQKMLASIIETEDAERKRFAEDLHDGLGPLLSTIKLYAGELNNNNHNNRIHDLLNSIIDDAIKNIRSIAYNIMPVELTKNGLDYAIKTFCNKITLVKNININIDSNIKNERFKWAVEKILYRILTELINNTLKHSEADKINIKLYLQTNILLVEYTDNGSGFNVTEKLNSKKSGLGLKNIINRIKIINGSVDIKSDKNGSNFYIKINI